MKRFVSAMLALILVLCCLPVGILAADSTITLDPDRTPPTAPQYSFRDSTATEWIDGSVLHYVDFSTVTSLDDIGYYVGSNATNDNTTLKLTDDGLYVKATNQKVCITPFGAEIPKQIQNYTIETTVKFVNASGKYLVFNPSTNATGTGHTGKGDLAFRPAGQLSNDWVQQKLYFHDKGQLTNGSTAEDAAAIMAAVKNGEWVTISFSVRNLGVAGVKVVCGDKTIYLQGNTAKAVLGSVWSFMLGNGNDEMYIKSIAMTAGYDLDLEQIWPENYVAGANILSVPESAIYNPCLEDLAADRVIPTAPEYSFTDSTDTKWVDGSVLHHVDFSTIRNLAEVGYYVGANANTDNTTLKITDDGLYVKATNQKVCITPFGAEIPKQIQNYTIETTVKFVNASGKYLVFNPSTNATGTGHTGKGDLAFRPAGQPSNDWVQQKLYFHDKGQLTNGSTAEDAAAIMAAVKNGEWVTISFSVRNLGVAGVKVVCGDKTIYLQGNTAKAVLGSVWSFMLGNGNDEMYIKSITMTAGYDLDLEQIWPENYVAGANILTVPGTAIEGGTIEPDEPFVPVTPVTPEVDITKPVELKVASYNIRIGGALYGYDMKALAADLLALGADVIVLQEVDNITERNNYQETLKILGETMGYYYQFNAQREEDGGEYGLGVLSLFPIKEVTSTPLYRTDDNTQGAILQHAILDMGGRDLHIYNTHLHYWNTLDDVYAVIKDSEPGILMGDFNKEDFDLFNNTFVGWTVLNQGEVTTNEGYKFDNIILSAGVEAVGDLVITNTKNSDHYAVSATVKIAPEAFTVTFEGAELEDATVTYGGKIEKPADPVKEGYTFTGWYKDEAKTTKWDFDNDTVTADVTLYAGWEEVPVVEYVVTFEGAELEAVKVVSGEKLTKPTDPVKEGYTFTGWYKDEAKTTKWDFDNDTVTADVTLYAGWEADVVPGTGDLFSGWVVLLGAISLLGLTTLPRRKQN